MASDGGQRPQGPPDYKVYRSRRRLLDRFRAPDLSRLRERTRGPRRPGRLRPGTDREEGGRRPWVRWVLIAAGAWLLLSFLAFAASATIQSTKLQDGVKDELGGSPNLVTGAQTILVLGSDQRQEGEAEPGAQIGGPSRADTIMLLRVGGGAFRTLSIPRDSFTEIPGAGAQKINAAYAVDDPEGEGNAALMIQTVEGFLDVSIDHIVEVDFAGFKDFINAIGGVKVHINEKICSKIHGGAGNGGFTLLLTRGDKVLHGETALALARTRQNDCNPGNDDLARANRQQLILRGIKGRLTSPLRIPYNFVKGPIIGWTAPKAIVSDMGALTMPQLVLAAIIGGSKNPDILKPSGGGPSGSLIISESERRRAVEKLLNG